MRKVLNRVEKKRSTSIILRSFAMTKLSSNCHQKECSSLFYGQFFHQQLLITSLFQTQLHDRISQILGSLNPTLQNPNLFVCFEAQISTFPKFGDLGYSQAEKLVFGFFFLIYFCVCTT